MFRQVPGGLVGGAGPTETGMVNACPSSGHAGNQAAPDLLDIGKGTGPYPIPGSLLKIFLTFQCEKLD